MLLHINICWFVLFVIYVGNLCSLYPAVFGSVQVWRSWEDPVPVIVLFLCVGVLGSGMYKYNIKTHHFTTSGITPQTLYILNSQDFNHYTFLIYICILLYIAYIILTEITTIVIVMEWRRHNWPHLYLRILVIISQICWWENSE